MTASWNCPELTSVCPLVTKSLCDTWRNGKCWRKRDPRKCETGLPGKVVGKVDIRERHSFVDVSTEHANAILAKLNRAEIKGHKVKIKAA